MAAPAKTLERKPRRLKWRIAAVYLALLALSHIVRVAVPHHQKGAEVNASVTARAVDGDHYTSRDVRVAFKEYLAQTGEHTTPILLLHGSPGRGADFSTLAPELAKSSRVLALDLPGFGDSTHSIPDYSIRAHARYTLEVMDRLQVERAHLVGFSMGGGVALNLAEIAPARVASITMLSAIGVQEMELLGDYHLNHALHGLQLAGLWTLREGAPHFGWLDAAMLGVEYARNFYDSDQRPLRDILARYQGPMLIIHGNRDPLVPVEAAREHNRLVPQSELRLLDDDHFMVFGKGGMLAQIVSEFINRAERERAPTRAAASPDRVAQAALPFNPAAAPKATGIAAVVMTLLIVASTFVTEDLTSIGVGVMVAEGRVGYLFGAFACFLGIFVGDVLLFLAGRYLGRPALKRAPLKWVLRPEDVEKSSVWFTRKGLGVIAASRFLPGARLPTYFAAGMLNTSLLGFSSYFLIAGAVWTPLLVGLSALLGGEVVKSRLLGGQNVLVKALIAIIIVYIAARLVVRLSTFKGRRLLLSSLRRKLRWEFWPPWVFYPPVLCYVIYLALRHRSLSVFTAANPAIPASGFVGESKAEILSNLSGSNGYVATARLIPGRLDVEERIRQARVFMAENGFGFPVVLKPDAGQRGSGVAVIRSDGELEKYLRRSGFDAIIQQHVAGSEFGVFYYRYPGEQRGRIFSITEKQFPKVVGDGRSTLERLILKDERAVCMAQFYLNKQGDRLWEIPALGQSVQLVELGTHCRGAVFLDGVWAKTDELESAIDQISKGYEGFYFGRFDIRAPSVEDFKRGRNFKVIELNGVTSEATHIYDPKNSLWAAYRILFEQWRIAFEIGAHNRARGVRPTSIRRLAKLLVEYRQQSGSHPE
jgi:pimeloyl-ACP methyl ester carboxylesterase/membrane protein DedA with SNARE-associated domain